MVKAIEFTVEPALLKTISAWRTWLSVERNCSDHTLDGYGRDLSTFLKFLLDHLGYRPGLRDLEHLKSADFRSYLAKRNMGGLSKSSTARAVSTLRNFSDTWTRRISFRMPRSAPYAHPNSPSPSPNR